MGNIYSTYRLIFPPKSLFAVDQIPDLKGQVIIVTGGNAGIGKETCKVLLNKNAKVYLASRSKSRADEAIRCLKRETGGKAPIFLELDLANLASVRKAVEEFKSKEHELHVLFNNAGVGGIPVNQRTANGYDMQFGTNNSPLAYGHVRVVNTSSMMAYFPPKGGIAWETLGADAKGVQACERLGSDALYSQSKLGNVLFANELAERYGEQGIVSASLHPGAIQTDITRHLPKLTAAILRLIFYPASDGALTQLWSGTMPEGVNHNGKASRLQFLIPWAQIGDTPFYARDKKLAGKLWEWLEEQVKGY